MTLLCAQSSESYVVLAEKETKILNVLICLFIIVVVVVFIRNDDVTLCAKF